MHFKKYFLLYSLIPLLILSTAASYYRFMVIHDYTVEYEGFCDPEVSSCFIGCEDEECTTEYYYTIIAKSASDLQKKCGLNIAECELAHTCLAEGDESCTVTYCDKEVDGEICSVTQPIDDMPDIVDESVPELVI
jgi:hypothetical protein